MILQVNKTANSVPNITTLYEHSPVTNDYLPSPIPSINEKERSIKANPFIAAEEIPQEINFVVTNFAPQAGAIFIKRDNAVEYMAIVDAKGEIQEVHKREIKLKKFKKETREIENFKTISIEEFKKNFGFKENDEKRLPYYSLKRFAEHAIVNLLGEAAQKNENIKEELKKLLITKAIQTKKNDNSQELEVKITPENIKDLTQFLSSLIANASENTIAQFEKNAISSLPQDEENIKEWIQRSKNGEIVSYDPDYFLHYPANISTFAYIEELKRLKKENKELSDFMKNLNYFYEHNEEIFDNYSFDTRVGGLIMGYSPHLKTPILINQSLFPHQRPYEVYGNGFRDPNKELATREGRFFHESEVYAVMYNLNKNRFKAYEATKEKREISQEVLDEIKEDLKSVQEIYSKYEVKNNIAAKKMEDITKALQSNNEEKIKEVVLKNAHMSILNIALLKEKDEYLKENELTHYKVEYTQNEKRPIIGSLKNASAGIPYILADRISNLYFDESNKPVFTIVSALPRFYYQKENAEENANIVPLVTYETNYIAHINENMSEDDLFFQTRRFTPAESLGNYFSLLAKSDKNGSYSIKQINENGEEVIVEKSFDFAEQSAKTLEKLQKFAKNSKIKTYKNLFETIGTYIAMAVSGKYPKDKYSTPIEFLQKELLNNEDLSIKNFIDVSIKSSRHLHNIGNYIRFQIASNKNTLKDLSENIKKVRNGKIDEVTFLRISEKYEKKEFYRSASMTLREILKTFVESEHILKTISTFIKNNETFVAEIKKAGLDDISESKKSSMALRQHPVIKYTLSSGKLLEALNTNNPGVSKNPYFIIPKVPNPFVKEVKELVDGIERTRQRRIESKDLVQTLLAIKKTSEQKITEATLSIIEEINKVLDEQRVLSFGEKKNKTIDYINQILNGNEDIQRVTQSVSSEDVKEKVEKEEEEKIAKQEVATAEKEIHEELKQEEPQVKESSASLLDVAQKEIEQKDTKAEEEKEKIEDVSDFESGAEDFDFTDEEEEEVMNGFEENLEEEVAAKPKSFF